MKQFPRHPFEVDKVQAQRDMLVKGVARDLNVLEKAPWRLADTCGMAQRAAFCLAALDGDPKAVLAHLRMSADAYGALFRGALETGPTFSSTIEPRHGVTLPTTGITDVTNVGRWIDGMLVSLMTRSWWGYDALRKVPESLLRTSVTKGEEFLYHHMRVLQAFATRDPKALSLLPAAVDSTDPDIVHPDSIDYDLYIIVPQMELVQTILLGKQDTFNDVLWRALDSHKKYWHRSPQKPSAADALVATGPLALVAQAVDRGFEVEIESEYLPPYIYAPIEP